MPLAAVTAADHTEAGQLRPVLRWLLLSLTLHLPLLLWQTGAEPPTLQPQALSVVLVERQAPPPRRDSDMTPPAQRPSPATQRVPAKDRTPAGNTTEATASTQRRSRERSQPGQPAAVTPPRQQLETAAERQADERAIRAQLQLALARHFRYPMMARRRGWQGEVVLAFRLQADGTISHAQIARSSGYGMLDRAALKALDRVKRLNHSMPATLDMQLPVIYRLEG